MNKENSQLTLLKRNKRKVMKQRRKGQKIEKKRKGKIKIKVVFKVKMILQVVKKMKIKNDKNKVHNVIIRYLNICQFVFVLFLL
jgi:hypothetical protein